MVEGEKGWEKKKSRRKHIVGKWEFVSQDEERMCSETNNWYLGK